MPFVSRDPFAREEVHYRKVTTFNASVTCDNCGRKSAGRGILAWLKQFYTESDGGRKSNIPGLFCSVGCMRDYHDVPR